MFSRLHCNPLAMKLGGQSFQTLDKKTTFLPYPCVWRVREAGILPGGTSRKVPYFNVIFRVGGSWGGDGGGWSKSKGKRKAKGKPHFFVLFHRKVHVIFNRHHLVGKQPTHHSAATTASPGLIISYLPCFTGQM